MPYTDSEAIIGKGAELSIGPAVGATGTIAYILIGELDDSTPTGRQWATEDVTNFQSPVDDEFKKTTRNPGEWDMTGNRIADDAGQLALEAAMDSLDNFMFKMVFPLAEGQVTTGETWLFNAAVISVDPSKITPKDVIKFAAKLKLSGSRTITAGA